MHDIDNAKQQTCTPWEEDGRRERPAGACPLCSFLRAVLFPFLRRSSSCMCDVISSSDRPRRRSIAICATALCLRAIYMCRRQEGKRPCLSCNSCHVQSRRKQGKPGNEERERERAEEMDGDPRTGLRTHTHDDTIVAVYLLSSPGPVDWSRGRPRMSCRSSSARAPSTKGPATRADTGSLTTWLDRHLDGICYEERGRGGMRTRLPCGAASGTAAAACCYRRPPRWRQL